MTYPTHREQLLTEGLRIVHRRGFAGTGIAEIARAAGVDEAVFAAEFASKEEFGLQLLDIYFANSCLAIGQTLLNDALPPMVRLRNYLALNRAHLELDGMRSGCLYGNFSAEGSDHSELIRHRIRDIFDHVQQAISYCLRAAAAAGMLRPRIEFDEMAGFAVASLQGAILLAKAQRSTAPIERFEQILFAMLEQH